MTLDQFKQLIGDLARPYCLIATGTATSWAIFDGKDASVITASGLILMVLYGAKAAEVAFGSKKTADVEIAKSGKP